MIGDDGARIWATVLRPVGPSLITWCQENITSPGKRNAWCPVRGLLGVVTGGGIWFDQGDPAGLGADLPTQKPVPQGSTLDTPNQALAFDARVPTPSAPGSWQPAGVPRPWLCRRTEEWLAGHSQGPPVVKFSLNWRWSCLDYVKQ